MEVSKILTYCNENRLAVCPQGGNTSIVGGSVPVLDEIVVSTELMNQIVSLDDVSGVLVCEAGCILEDLDNKLSKLDLMMPLDLGAKGSCHIGGNVSTNAGGLRLLRYGNLHGNILGLEVVKANGEILDLLSMLKKDNTGYHLKHLFIGSEGTLGFVTKVAVQCPTKPKTQNLAFLGLENYENVLETFKAGKGCLSEILSAIEVIDNESMDVVREHLNLRSPIGEYPYYLLIETSGSRDEHDQEKLNSFVEMALAKRFILNGTVVTEPSKFKDIWSIREKIPETFKREGYVFCYDFTLPLQNYYKLVHEMRQYMGSQARRVFGFGHLGDGNLHLQISIKEFNPDILDYIEPHIFNRVKEMKGSISSEHGIGFLKAKYLSMIKDPNAVRLMQSLKASLDPNGILNPYKIFRS
ncbi:d-2-hydroxyglutarate dehydrogenase mitochondrial [Holotrichia oblita]|uniref:D-2-hydroxyglutarate dehydrogenase mitochondrial n=1 Tax=Holotrichia oblita TaxID=644536 RepID=A0ACB9THU5_HOLOL|nr:d-2-hydroxyglutarate dehydrogenase mitochondrial [Holotrichia oblita]